MVQTELFTATFKNPYFGLNLPFVQLLLMNIHFVVVENYLSEMKHGRLRQRHVIFDQAGLQKKQTATDWTCMLTFSVICAWHSLKI